MVMSYWHLPARWGVLCLMPAVLLLQACGGGDGGTGTATVVSPPASRSPTLAPPSLRFTDTGLSVSDGITRTGLWSVGTTDGLGWEFSLDFGQTWSRGEGGGFEVKGDGQKTIWVRSRDDQGNLSEVVVVQCTLDTMPPAALSTMPVEQTDLTRLQLQGLEMQSAWEYSVNEGQSWIRGSGQTVSVMGNAFSRLRLRQIDLAGNPSEPLELRLDTGKGWVEASTNALVPNVLGPLDHTLLIHGDIVRDDADFVRFDVPAGFRLRSVVLTHYASSDAIAFYAIQRKEVFDAGTDVSKMMSYGHFGPGDLGRNLIESVPAALIGAGPLTVWVNQTGSISTRYMLQVDFARIQ
jgi:hypothetical protein